MSAIAHRPCYHRRGMEIDRVEAERFARDVRALLGFERLPDPISHWVVALPSGELALRRTLSVGKLELRRWDGELVLYRRPVGNLKPLLDKILDRPLLDELHREALDDGEIVEWRCSGPFEKLHATRRAKSVRLVFTPRREAEIFATAHEENGEVAIARLRGRHRPPGPWALPTPLKMPPGGRYPKRAPVKKKRVKR